MSGIQSTIKILSNLTATVAPTVNDDNTKGYSVGSTWIDVTGKKVYTCIDSSVGVAVWNSGSVQNSFDKTVDPTSTDDSSLGYEVGSVWINVTANTIFTCVDATASAAIWSQEGDAIPTSEKGVANGVSTLDATGNVPGSQLGNVVVPVDSVAGKTGAVTLTPSDAGAEPANANIQSHIGSSANPHGVTASQAGAIPNSGGLATALAEAVNNIGNTIASQSIDFNLGHLHIMTLAVANTSLTFTNLPVSGQSGSITLEIHQDATGNRLITWPAIVKWASGTAPALSSAASSIDIITLYTSDAGTTWYGFVSGLGMA